MSLPSSLRAGPFLAALTVLVFTACNDQTTQPVSRPAQQDANPLAICTIACGIGNPGGGIIVLPPNDPPTSFGITALSLADNTLPIGGAGGSYTATLNNTGGAINSVVLQGFIAQGTARRAAGGTMMNCGSGTGVLPHGNCTMSFSVAASNTASGTGTLIPGIATFQLELRVGTSTITRSIGVNLIPGTFSASGDVTYSLAGTPGRIQTSITNTGSQTYSSYSYQMTVTQGSARRSAGSMPLACPSAGWGNLPGNTTCAQTLHPIITNSSSGTGTLVAGFATMLVQLLHGTTVVSSVQWQVTLLDAHFTNVTPAPNAVVIDAPASVGSYTILNNGPALVHNGVGVIGMIRQGTTVRGIEGSLTTCVAGNQGSLPTGDCQGTVRYAAPGYASTDGQLQPGPATLAVIVRGLNITIDSVLVPITLVAPTP